MYYRAAQSPHLSPLLLPPPIRLLAGGGWFPDRAWLLTPFFFIDPETGDEIRCATGQYNGFSIPWYVCALGAGRLSNLMAGIEASMVHDRACVLGIRNAKYRRQLFRRALNISNAQLHDGKLPRISTLAAGVHIGSTWMQQC